MKKFSYKSLFDVTQNIFEKIGLPPDEAYQAADILLQAELRNIPTHGLMRMPEYINLWKTKRITVKPDFKIIRQTPSTALVDGGKGFGLVTGPKAMKIAIEKAKNAGTGWVAVRNTYHYGIAGYYAMMALEHDMIGISMTNANPLVAPTFGLTGMLGTNPIAVAVPTKNQPPFVADFATAPVARGKLDVMVEKGLDAPEGVLQDKYGHPTTNAAALREGGALKTLGGDPERGGHKGFCLTAIVDILTAVLPGANFGPTVVPTLGYVKDKKNSEDKGIGHFFGAIRIDAFQTAEEFKEYMDEWITTFRKTETIPGKERVIIPGDPERESEKEKLKNGIELSPKTLKSLLEITSELGLNFSEQ